MTELLVSKRHICLIDDEDLTLFKAFKWSVIANKKKTNHYVIAHVGRSYLYLHRLILNAPKGMVVDHVNHNGLDNRRKNLRLCSQSQNQHNRHKWIKKASCAYKGVWLTKNNTWEAKIAWGGKQRYIGTFSTAELAASAYDSYARVFHGAYAKLNYPEVKPC